MLILFFDSKGVIHHKYVHGQIANATFYVQVLDHLCKRIVCVRPEIWRDWKFIILHDNAHLHTTAIVLQFLIKKKEWHSIATLHMCQF